MKAVYDKQVRKAIDNYDESLKSYPISPQRRKIKVQQLKRFLQSLSKTPTEHYPVCDKINLGQVLNNGQPVKTYLRFAHYEDESKTQWSVSFYRVSQNKVKIYRLIQSENVKESKRKTVFFTKKQINMLLENMNEDK